MTAEQVRIPKSNILPHNRSASGQLAEKLARDFLERQGLITLARRFKVKLGEIDLIMGDGETTVFVEVRYRSSPSFGGAISSINSKKRKSLQKAALCWIQANPGVSRFDVIAIDGDELKWIQNAFSIAL